MLGDALVSLYSPRSMRTGRPPVRPFHPFCIRRKLRPTIQVTVFHALWMPRARHDSRPHFFWKTSLATAMAVTAFGQPA
jgi:hypothetical protein